MRIFAISLLVTGLSLTSCSRGDRAHREEPVVRQAGKDAYRASQDLKKGAKEAAQELKNAGTEFRQGWNQAKHQNRTEPQK